MAADMSPGAEGRACPPDRETHADAPRIGVAGGIGRVPRRR